MIDFFLRLLEIVLGAGIAVVSSILVYKSAVKTKQMDIDASREAKITELAQDVSSLKNTVADMQETVDGSKQSIADLKELIIELKAALQQAFASIDLLSSRVEKHNGVIERTFTNERDIAVIKQKESEQDRRLEHLEQKA